MSTKIFSQRKANHIRMVSQVLALGLAAIYSCSTYEPAPLESEIDFLPAPTKVTVKVGNGAIDLSWLFEDTSLVKEYRVYRRDQDESSFRRIASTRSQSYHDDLLVNGMRYEYQVAAVSRTNLEGEHSKTVAVTPAIYGLLLSGGSKYASRHSIIITMTAPQNTTLMMLSNDSSLSNAQWEPFANSRQWELSFGDGPKTVYAKFRNAEDQELTKPVKANIILDTMANIRFVEEDSEGRTLSAPQKLHIRLDAGETQGKATADILDPAVPTAKETDIRLYDDGTNGDKVPHDGIYETDYHIRNGLEVLGAYVFGYFTDAAGNVAPQSTASGRVTIQSSLSSVILKEPTTIVGSSTSLSLQWTQNIDRDFVSYQIRRSRTFVVSESSVMVTSINDQKATTYLDTGLEPSTEYYYRVYVLDAAGNSSGSNIAQGKTPVNEPPKPVVLSQPIPDTLSLKLSWSPSTENDFANYRLYRSTTSPVDTSFAPIVIINNQTQTEFRDFSVVPNLLYYYRLFVFDRFGLTAGSNEVQGRLSR